jgi:hypothetical protein
MREDRKANDNGDLDRDVTGRVFIGCHVDMELIRVHKPKTFRNYVLLPEMAGVGSKPEAKMSSKAGGRRAKEVCSEVKLLYSARGLPP